MMRSGQTAGKIVTKGKNNPTMLPAPARPRHCLKEHFQKYGVLPEVTYKKHIRSDSSELRNCDFAAATNHFANREIMTRNIKHGN